MSAGTIDRGAARIAARRLVEAASLRPPGLPPSALLCVRRLGDPLPGTLQLDVGALVPDADWRRAAADALATQAREAARPALGPVPASAGAVLFADRAELLAALARDWLDGSLATRWWWAILLRSPFPSAVEVARAWREEATSAPAAFERLAARGEAARFAAQLPVDEALALAHVVAHVHGQTAVAAVLAAARAPAPVRPTAPPSGVEPQQAAPAAEAIPVWTHVVREAVGSELLLTRPARALLVVALTAARSPVLARSPRFVRALQLLLDEAAPPEAPVEEPPHAVLPVVEAPPQPAATPVRAASQRLIHGAARPVERPPVRRARATPAPPAIVQTTAATPQPRTRAQPSTPPLPPTAIEPRTADDAVPTATRTDLAGVFMLLNVALGLGLYSDFTLNVRRELAVDPWRLVARTARRLLHDRHRRDAVWPLLDSLAADGRDRYPRTWRPPRAWLEPFDVVPSFGDGDWQATFVAYVRARVALALDVRPARVAGTLLRLPGVVHVSAARVDVVMALEDLPVGVRLAGLDRDPGWIPRARRDVRFHFE